MKSAVKYSGVGTDVDMPHSSGCVSEDIDLIFGINKNLHDRFVSLG